MWKTVFKNFEVMWSATSNFFKGCLLGPFLNTLTHIQNELTKCNVIYQWQFSYYNRIMEIPRQCNTLNICDDMGTCHKKNRLFAQMDIYPWNSKKMWPFVKKNVPFCLYVICLQAPVFKRASRYHFTTSGFSVFQVYQATKSFNIFYRFSLIYSKNLNTFLIHGLHCLH